MSAGCEATCRRRRDLVCPRSAAPESAVDARIDLFTAVWGITDGAVVLVGGEPTCDMNWSSNRWAGGDLRECCRRCVPVCVDPKGGSVVRRRWSSTSDWRIGTPRPPSTSSSVMPSSSCGNSISSSVVGSVWSAKGLIAVCSSCWLVRRQSVRRCVFCHTRVIVHKPDKPRRGASAFHRRSETVA